MGSIAHHVKRIYDILEEQGYRPTVVGTYALILQGWLPESYLVETKDIDLYVPDPMIAFDDGVEAALLARGYGLGRSDSGGLYVDLPVKPVEIVYPLHDVYVPPSLLDETVAVSGMRVLEGHAALVAKSLGAPIEHLADVLKGRGVSIDVSRIRRLAARAEREVEHSKRPVLRRRVARFLDSLASTGGRGVMVDAG